MAKLTITNIFYTAALVIIVIAGIFVVYPGLNNCFSVDEARSADIAALSFTGIISEVAKDNHPPLYYLILALWMRIFGNSESGLRLLSVLFYIAGAFCICSLVNYIYKNKGTGLFTAALFVFSQIAMRHSVNARMYSMLSPVIALSFLFFIKTFLNNENTLKNAALLITVNIIGSFIHYWFLFVVLGEIIFAVVFSRKKIKEITVVFLLSLLPLFLLWGRVFIIQATNGSMNFIRIQGDEIQRTLKDFFAPKAGFFALFIIISLAAYILRRLIETKSVLILTDEYLAGITTFFKDKNNLFLLTLFFILLVVPFIISKLFIPVYFPGRYTITTFIPFVVISGGFLYKFSERRLLWVLLLVYFIFFTAPKFLFNTEKEPCWEASKTKSVIQDLKNGDVLFYLPLTWISADYYLMRFKNTKNIIKTGFPDENYIKHPCWSNTYKLSNTEQIELKVKCAELKEFLKKGHARIILYWGRSPYINEQVLKEFKINFKEEYNIKQNDKPEITYFESK